MWTRTPLSLFCITACAAVAHAQCDRHWEPIGGVPGVSGSVRTLALWDPDGSGSQSPLLVVGGSFNAAGDQSVSNVASWRNGVWSTMGTVVGFAPSVLLVRHDGSLIGGGSVTSSGGFTTSGLYRWDGSTWTLISVVQTAPVSGVVPFVESVTELPNGDLLVGGRFTEGGAVPANNIARWDGTSWSALGAGVGGSTAPRVSSIVQMPDGSIIASGVFTTAGDVNALNIARWDGTTWSPLAGGLNQWTNTLAVMSSGDLAAAGSFTTAGGLPMHGLARWNGAAWNDIGGGSLDTTEWPVPLIALPDNGLLMAGLFPIPGGTTRGIARWDGAQWNPFGAGLSSVALAVVQDQAGGLFAGGSFGSAGGLGVRSIARWDGQNWSALSSGFNGPARAIAASSDGDQIVGGDFTTTPNGPANHIARWHNGNWTAIGAGLDGVVRAITIKPDGTIVAGGDFHTSAGVPVVSVAQWDGANWVGLGDGFDNSVDALAVTPSGDIVAGGTFSRAGSAAAARIARWDGTAWSPLGAGASGGNVYALALAPDGTLIAGGNFVGMGGSWPFVDHVARWNGTSWSAMGSTLIGEVDSLLVKSDGSIHAGGDLESSIGNKVARWNGTTWVAVGSGLTAPVRALVELEDGEIVAGGDFGTPTSLVGTNLRGVARWNGTTWLAEGLGMDQPVLALSTLAGRIDYMAGGTFVKANGLVSPTVAISRQASGLGPTIVQQPQDVSACHTPITNTLSVGATSPTGSPLAYSWRKDGVFLTDAARVSGSSTSVLLLDTWYPTASGVYDVVVTSADGCVVSRSVNLHTCRADFNCSGTLEVQDIFDFLSAWFAGNPNADIDGNQSVNLTDILSFINLWFGGC